MTVASHNGGQGSQSIILDSQTSDEMIYKREMVKRWKERGLRQEEQLKRGSQTFQIQERVLVKNQ